MSDIEELLKQRILVLDGAMGTMLQGYNFTETDFRGDRFKDWSRPLQGNNDLLSLTQPDAIAEVHRKYLQAGADILETNTFSATSVAMADYGMETLAREMNRESARIAKGVADEVTSQTPEKPRFVAGSIGRPIKQPVFHRMSITRDTGQLPLGSYARPTGSRQKVYWKEGSISSLWRLFLIPLTQRLLFLQSKRLRKTRAPESL